MMTRAVFEIMPEISSKYVLVIRDIGPWDKNPTVTNDAEAVAKELAEMGQLPRIRRLFYYDSEGHLDEILVKNGAFAGFSPGMKTDGAPKTERRAT